MFEITVKANKNKHLVKKSPVDKHKLTAAQLKALLLVSEVQLNVPVKSQPEEENDEASQSPEPSGAKTPAAGGQHHQAP
jgi:hypothetical protein